MKAKRLLFLTIMALCATSAWAYTFSAVAPSGQTLYYNIVDGNAQVTYQNGGSPWYTNLTGDLVIPASVTYNNVTYSVTSIGWHSFRDCTGLTTVTIPNSVTSIGGYAFRRCTGLTTVTIPNSVTNIEGYAFYGCTGLTSVTIPSSVTSIGEYAFYNVRHIEYHGTATGSPWGAITMNGVTEGDFVYADETKQQLLAYVGNGGDVTIPSTVNVIGEWAFFGCTGLTSVTIPNSVTSIGSSAFEGCTGLTSVTIPNSVTSIGNYTFSDCTGLTSVTIPNSVTSIGSRAFRSCTGLTSATIGNSVTSIGSSAFYGCSGLINFVSRATYPPACGDNVFNNVPAYCTLTVPCGSQVYYSVTSPWNSAFPIMNEDCRDEYTVTAISDDSMMGSASVDGAETATVLDGDVVTVIATSNPGYHFLRWNDDNTDSVRTVEVHGNVTYTAYFASNSTEAIDDVNGINIKVYAIDGKIVVEGRENRPVWVLDMYGRVVDNGQLPSGVYLVKVGTLPARKVVVIR